MTPQPTDPNSSSNPTEPGAIVSGASDTAVAESFITAELHRASVSLRATQIAGTTIVLLLGVYLLYITSVFVREMQPAQAAQTAESVIVEQVHLKGPDIAEQIKTQIPEYIAKTPDYVKEQLPKYRLEAERRVEAEMKKYCDASTDKLTTHLDKFLDDHKDEVKTLITSANDPATLKAVGNDLKSELLAYLDEKPQDGESIGQKITSALQSLKDVEQKMHRLAVNKNLSQEEKQTRHAIAVLSTAIDHSPELQRVSGSIPIADVPATNP